MIKSLSIEGLRGIVQGTVEGLAPVTFLVGPNGCGKTTVLEAAALACAYPNPVAIFAALAGREWLGVAGAEKVVNDTTEVRATLQPGATAASEDVVGIVVRPRFQRTSATRLRVTCEGETERFDGRVFGSGVALAVIQEDGGIHADPEALFTIPFHRLVRMTETPARVVHDASKGGSGLRTALGVLKQSPAYDTLINALRVLRPSILSIELMPMGDINEPWIFEGPPRQGYPVAYAGDGFARAVLFASVLARAQGGVATIDEPEAYAHPRMFSALASLLKPTVAAGTQVIFATHSLEFIETVVRIFEDTPEAISVIGLRLEDGVLESFPERGKEAYRRIVTLKDDLRL
jgi:energy-coupling factor transporter ATP-binding protein EcfA2